jgi:predicted dehydrogenase
MIDLGVEPDKKVFYKETGVIGDVDILKIDLKAQETNIGAYLNRASLEKRKTVTLKTADSSYIWNDQLLFKIIGASQDKEKIEVDASFTPVVIEIKDFIEAIRQGRQPKYDGEFASKVLRVVELLDQK